MKLLFERLESMTVAFDLKLAVLNNVQRLLSSRESFSGGEDEASFESDVPGTFDVLSCAMPSVVELAGGSLPALEAYGARFCALIAHYEPRLREPHVGVEGGGGAPWRLIVSGRLDTPGGAQPLRFPLELRGDG